MITQTSAGESDIVALRDAALGVRESVNATRARLQGQRATIALLRAELESLRLAARTGAPPAPKAAAAAPRRRSALRPLAPYAALAFFALLWQAPQRRAASLPAIAAPAQLLRAEPESLAAVDDDRGAEAIALVNEWQVPGDDRPLLERFDGEMDLPGAQPAWSAERTGETTYRVSFRPSPDEVPLEFEVDLSARRVVPSSGTAELLAPRLTARR